jgi:hypothetical protein
MQTRTTRTLCAALATAALIGPLTPGTAQAQERHRYERNSHWVYDTRFHHNHYYPAAGYAVTVLPGGKRIEAAEIRGIASAGMLCSAVELGVGDDDSGLLTLAGEVTIGAPIAQVLGLDDAVIEVSITPNQVAGSNSGFFS